MLGLRQLLSVLVLVYTAAACSTSSVVVSDLNLVPMEPEEFRTRTRTIALATTRVMVDMPDKGSVKAEFDSLVEARFRAEGFSVVRVGEFDETVERITEEMGGVFDPKTGEPDSVKVRMVYQQALGEIRDEIDPDVVIIPTIEVVAVRVDNTAKAEWLGASECIDPPLVQIFGSCGTTKYSGTLPALSFFVTVFDMDAVVLFRNGGGLQILERPGGRIPRDELFDDKDRNTDAVGIAVDPLVGAR